MAPIGYLNARSEAGEKIIVTDSMRFPILRKLWDLFLGGGYSVPQILDIATNEMGLRTPKRRRIGGNPLSPSGIYRMFVNPFYAGQLAYENQWYPGKHEPMVTLAEFDKVLALLGRPGRARAKKHEFAYTGLIRCGTCGVSVTAEGKVNRYGSRYVYYHCTHKKRSVSCDEKCVEEEQLEEQLLAYLMSVELDTKELSEALTVVEEERAKEHREGNQTTQAIEQALITCRRNLDNLTKLRYRELISDEEFVRQREEVTREEIRLCQQLERLGTEHWIEPSRNLFLFSNRAAFWLAHGTLQEKRLIVSTVGSNLSLRAKKLSIDAKKPFSLLEKNGQIRNWCTIVNDVRTFFRKEPGIVIPLLRDPKDRFALGPVVFPKAA